MTEVTKQTPIRAAALISTYVDVMRAIALVESAEGFADYPVLTCAAMPDGRIYTDTLGVSPKRHITGYLTYLRGELETQRRQLYETLTNAFHVTPGELRRHVRDRLDVETDPKDGGYRSWAAAGVEDDPDTEDVAAEQAEAAIFNNDEAAQ